MKSKKMTAGFTLVELIVVITILGILAGVGTVGYSGYIKKANMAADQTLIAGIKTAAELAGMGGELSNGTGYILVTNDKDMPAEASSAELEAAMAAAFGDDWTALRLQYGGWDAGILAQMDVSNQDYIAAVSGSTYISSVGTEKLLTDVQNCTNALSGFVTNLTNGNYEQAHEIVKTVMGEGYTDAVGTQTLTGDTISNAVVFGVAAEVKDDTDIVDSFKTGALLASGPSIDHGLAGLANWYAAAEAYVAYANNEDITNAFNAIDMTGNDADAILESMGTFQSVLLSRINRDPTTYNNYTSGQAERDGKAYVAIMSTVDNMVDDDFVKDGMSSSNLFTGEEMNNSLNSYTASTGLASTLTQTQWNELLTKIDGKSAVVVVVTSDGLTAKCAAAPTNAMA